MSFIDSLVTNNILQPEENIFKTDVMKSYLYEATEILNAEERQILYLRYWSNLNLQEIAQFMNKRAFSTDQILNSSILKLRDEIEKLIKQEQNLKKEINKCL
jgi:DNA-directed RNA polymerase specialized sigma subunit